jgi:polysaccharide export outer membrane protein
VIRNVILGAVFAAAVSVAQQAVPAAGEQPLTPAPPPSALDNAARQSYTISVNDQIAIRALDVEELNAGTYRIDSDGSVNLPIVGRIAAAGLTIRDFEAQLTSALKRYVREPQVIVSVVQAASLPVFFVGPFRSPGVYGLQGQRRLMDMLTVAGGLQTNTIRRIRLTRRAAYGPIPLPNAVDDPDRKVSSVDITVSSLQDGSSAAENLILQPYDVITAERAEMIYMSGAVGRVGGLEIGERESLTLTQALAMVGGITRTGGSKVHVLRPVLDTNRRADIEIDVKQIYAGKVNDFPLMPNDHVYVRPSRRKEVATTALPWIVASLPVLLVQAIW